MSNYEKTILIDGMQCEHCKMRVEKVLNSIDGITRVEVIFKDKKAIIESSKEIDNDKIFQTLDDIGFEVKEIK